MPSMTPAARAALADAFNEAFAGIDALAEQLGYDVRAPRVEVPTE